MINLSGHLIRTARRLERLEVGLMPTRELHESRISFVSEDGQVTSTLVLNPDGTRTWTDLTDPNNPRMWTEPVADAR